MKRTDTLTKLVSLLLFGALLCYLGVYIVRALKSGVRTAPAVYVTLAETVPAPGIVVRNETLINSGEKYLSVVAETGKLLAKGETVAVTYSSEEALSRAAKIKELESQKTYIRAVLEGAQDAENLSDRDSAVRSAVTDLAAAAARHETDELSAAAITLSSLVISSSNVEATQAQLDAVQAQLDSLNASASHDTVAITAPAAGLFSAAADGYEYITPEKLAELTPSALKKLEESPETVSENVRGKLCDPYQWYFAATIPEKDAAKLKTGGSATLSFGRYSSAPFKMRVVSIGQASGGRCVVVFRCTKSPADMLSVRRTTAELEFNRHEGIRVPKEAVLKDGDGTYIFTLTGMQAEKKYVEISYETDDYYLVKVSEDAGGLRVGNEIILSTKGVTDGKVLRDR
ncbi:MAG: HlyD family efflux transporter periplasmic adaptor subunit [Oscillospiraceae bacterium]|jgi:hypothetical protein